MPLPGSFERQGGARRVRAWNSAARFVFPWFVPAFFCLLVKLSLMANGKGFRVVARYLGRVEGTGYTGLSFWERLTFFRGEILIEFLVIPLALLVLFRYLPRSWRVFLSAASSAVVALVLFVQIRALEEMGQYLSFRMFLVGLTWGIYNPGANKGYLLTREFCVFLAGLVIIVALLWRAIRSDRESASDQSSSRGWRVSAALYVAVAGSFALLAWRPLLSTTPYHVNVLQRAFASLWSESGADTREFTGLSNDLLVDRYRKLMGAPASRKDPRYFDKQRRSNVIFFILETTPARFLPSDDSLVEFPNLRRLEDHSFVAEQHYTTYPYTNRALFSIFTAWYPSDGIETFGEERPGIVLPGLARTLSSQGYATAIYLPSLLHGEADLSTFQAFGFAREVFPDPAALPSFEPRDLEPAWKAERIGRDRAVFELLKSDIERWLIEGRPFAAVFVPQVGHLPFPDRGPESGDPQIVKRGREILSLEDSWLGQLLDMLERHWQLENTVIVITGDHGIRTRHEDPSFTGGTIDEYSFHVPLRIFAAKAVEKRTSIPWVTSHIDVTPSVLELLGVERSRGFEQGAPIWEPTLAARTTFFLARQAFGTDGYHSGAQFFMWNQISDSVYRSGEPHFALGDLLPRDSSDAQGVIRSILRFNGLEQVWALQFGRGPAGSAAVSSGAGP